MLYPNTAARVILRNADGSPLRRWTLQMVHREGRTLVYTPDAEVNVGQPPNLWRALTLRGFRPSLELKWSRGLWSTWEKYQDGAWVTGGIMPTVSALLDITTGCDIHAVDVEPCVGIAAGAMFTARAYSHTVNIQDEKFTTHVNLDLMLEGTTLLPSIPDFGVAAYFDTEGGQEYFDQEGGESYFANG